VILQEESYTSVANFLNDDPLPVYGQITEKPVFSGNRISRGLYRTDKGILVQSDVMGSYNILRKAFPNAFNRYGRSSPKENQSLEVKVKGISEMEFSLSIFDYTFTNYI
jgi:hypothetical protein